MGNKNLEMKLRRSSKKVEILLLLDSQIDIVVQIADRLDGIKPTLRDANVSKCKVLSIEKVEKGNQSSRECDVVNGIVTTY